MPRKSKPHRHPNGRWRCRFQGVTIWGATEEECYAKLEKARADSFASGGALSSKRSDGKAALARPATGKQLLLDAVCNRATPRAAWIPFVGVHGGKIIGVGAAEYLQSADLIVRGMLRAKELYLPDGLPVTFDLQLEAEVLGCELKWAAETPPAVVSHPLSNGNGGEFPAFDVSLGRFPLVLDALRKLKHEIGQDTALYGPITGPFTLALHLMGNEIFLKIRRDPARVQRLLACCSDVGKKTAEAYLDAGADVIPVVDPMTSQISPQHFNEFVRPHVDAVFQHIRARGGLSSMFVCGDATRNLEAMCQTMCDNVSIDENVPLELCKELGAKFGRSFGGNLKLTTALLLGDEDDAKLEALRCLEIGGTNGFVLAPGCDLPYGVPERNLQAVALMVHDAYQRHVAATSLRAKTAASFDDVQLPDYATEDDVIVDVITLDSASCAPCQYMVSAAAEAAAKCGGRVAVREHKITTHDGLAYMSKLGVSNLPTICIDGDAQFVSIMPDANTLVRALHDAAARKDG